MPTLAPPRPAVPRLVERFDAIGTYVHLGVREPADLAPFTRLARNVLAHLDRTCSRFRADSDLARANAAAGRWVAVDPLLVAAVEAALAAAEQTDGLVNPLLGTTLVELGYDRTFRDLRPSARPAAVRVVDREVWRGLGVSEGAVRVPRGTALDLGCTAKAFGADLIAATAAEAGVRGIVSLGGDVAVTATGSEPWEVAISTLPDAAPDATIGLVEGGVATSSSRVRRWSRGGVRLHHLLDPRTGRPVPEVWHTVTAIGRSATAANVASTAAMVLGTEAPAWLQAHGVAARLVGDRVLTTGDWPEEV